MRILAVLVIVLAVVHAPASAAHAREQTTTIGRATLEAAVIRELNRVRSEHGLKPLRAATSLRTAARVHSKAMLDQGFFGHESPDGTDFGTRIKRYYTSSGWQAWSVGEALMATQTSQTQASTVVATWLASPPHRQILFSRTWREVGIGALYAPVAPREFGNAETTVVTADFGVRR